MSTLTAPVAEPIARYVDALKSQVDGPRRAKADMLKEVSHGLRDAADGYAEAGIAPLRAAETAVAEFGDPSVVAVEIQTELAALQARHALAVMAVIGPIGEVVARILWSNSTAPITRPSPFASWLASVVDVFGWSSSILAAVLLVAFGLGARWMTFRAGFVRVVGYGLLGKLVAMAVLGMMLSILFGDVPVSGGFQVLAMAQGLLVPALTAYAGWLGWRCIKVAAVARRHAVPQPN